MIAQCGRCKHTFRTDRFGAQPCPNCGTQVYVEEPPEGAPAPEGTPVDEGGPPRGEPPDWERRDELGFLAALIGTWKKSLLRPAEFFEGAVGSPGRGVFWYGFVWSVVGGLFNWLWQWLFAGSQQAELAQALEAMRSANPEMAKMLEQWMSVSQTGGGAIGLLWVPVGAALGIFIWAGLLHLGAMIFGAAGGGWDATFKTVCYGQGPQVFNIVPQVGPLIALIWGTVIQVVGIQKLHGTTTGKATLVVLLWYLLCCFCVCGSAMFAVMGLAGAAGAGGLQ